MSINVSKTTLYNTGSISFSDLRSNFKESSSGPIKASELKRNTSLTDTNPIVPDATENSNISTSNDWKPSQFRGSIKKYNLIQSSTDTNLPFQSQSWNNNLDKNIIKKIFVTGTIGATATNVSAAQIDASVCNLEIDVSGGIYASGGAVSSGAGGNALYVNNTANRSASTSTVIVNVNPNGTIRGGGGAGSNGNSGNSNTIGCYSDITQVNRGDGNSRSGCGAPGCGSISGYNLISQSCNGDRNNGSCRCSNSCRRCYRQWDRTCVYRTTFTLTSNGGTGGNFGVGRGYNTFNSSLSGNQGNSGVSVNCSNGGTAIGNPGNYGNSGAEWGLASAGGAGKAVYRGSGNTFLVQGSTGNIYGERNN